MSPSPGAPLALTIPGVQDPSAFEMLIGTNEPTGTLPTECGLSAVNEEEILPPTPTRSNFQAPDPFVALLVGEPPPPPPTPPPRKRRGSSGRGSSGRRKKLVEVRSPDQRSSLSGISPNSDKVIKTFEHRSLDSPSEEENRYIAERLEAARDAIHKSDVEPSLGINTEVSHVSASADPPSGTRRVSQTINLPTPVVKVVEAESNGPTEEMNLWSIDDDNITAPSDFSHASISTEQHSNHLQKAPLLKKEEADAMSSTEALCSPSSVNKSVSSKASTHSGKPRKKFRPKTPERLRQAHRALTPDRKRLLQKAGVADPVKTKGLDSPASASRSVSTKSTHGPVSVKKFRPKTPERLRRALTPDRKRSKTPDKKRPKNLQKKGTKTLDKKSLKPFERHREKEQDLGDSKNQVQQAVNLQQAHTDNDSSKSDKHSNRRGFLRGFFWHKKKRAGVGEPDIATVSSEALLSTQNESAKSKFMDETINDNRGGDEKTDNMGTNGEDHKFEAFEGSPDDQRQDEVSTLTAPTYYMRRQDPSDHHEAMSDPVGHYFDSKSDIPVETTEPNSIGQPAIDAESKLFSDEPEEMIEFSVDSFSSKSNLHVEVDNTPFDPFGELPHSQGAGPRVSNYHRSKIRDPTPTGKDDALFNAHQLKDPSPRLRNPSPMIQDPSPGSNQAPSFIAKSFQADPFGESPLHENQGGPPSARGYVTHTPLSTRVSDDSPSHAVTDETPGNSCWRDATRQVKPATLPVGTRKGDDSVETPLSPQLPPTPAQRMRALRLHRLSVSPAHRDASDQAPIQNKQLNGIKNNRVHSADQKKEVKGNAPPADSSMKGKFSSAALSIRMSRRVMSPRIRSHAVAANTPLHGNRKAAEDSNEPVDSDLVLRTSSSQFSYHEENALGKSNLSIASEAGTSDSVASANVQDRTKHLTMSSAARINAKAVAYLHNLNGDPSPRRAWRKPEESEEEASPRRGIRDPRDPLFSSIEKCPSRETSGSSGETKSIRMFSVYDNRFRGRKPGKKEIREAPQSTTLLSRQSPPSQRVPKSKEIVTTKLANHPITPFLLGVRLLRKKREHEIQSGASKRVVPQKMLKTPKVNSYFDSEFTREPRDPIQRAGRRLLSKAAIPVQAQIRRFLAQREAVDRMWATIEIQSYSRRWRAEASLLAYRKCSITIQKVFRRHQVIGALERREMAAVEIQRVARGFIASVHTFETVYRIILIQAKLRGNLVRKRVRLVKDEAARCIQTWWRARSKRMQYQLFIVDLIIAQSAFRRWRARQEYTSRRFAKMNEAATKIQSMWRCFQGYTDYIFSVVDILLVQRTARQWLARRKLNALRCQIAAVKIQCNFRKHRSQLQLLRQLMQIIIIQSIVRRRLAQKQKRKAINSVGKIQTAWRGFWSFSHYVILIYHVSRIQALVRGTLVRKNQNLQLGCSIMIQSAARRFFAKKEVENVKISKVLVMSAAKAMREKLACNRIQFWWRVVLECRKEKRAALAIERFFMQVKREVDKEINRSTRKKNSKRKQSRRTLKEEDEKWLERVWLNTVDETNVEAFVQSPSESTTAPRKTFPSKHDRNALSHRASSPTLNHIMRHELATKKSLDGLNLTYSVDGNDLSPSSPSLPVSPRRTATMSVEELQDDLSLEEAFLDAAVEQGKKRRNTAEKYMKRFGLRSFHNTSCPPSHHFFADDLESTCSSSIQGAAYSLSKSPPSSPPSRQKKKAPQSTKSSSSHHARQLLHKMGHNVEKKPPMSPRNGESPRHGKILVMEYPEYSSKREPRKAEKEEEYVGEEFGLI